MKYGNIKNVDIANGPGVRVSLFVSGCRNRCKGCFNPETWDFNFGKPYTRATVKKIIKLLKPYFISGLSILGGDPFEKENYPDVLKLCKLVKEKYPDKTIWVYTGYLYENLEDLEIMEYVDVLVDGPFVEDLKNISLRFRGSSNQRIIDVPATRKNGVVTWWGGVNHERKSI